MVCAKPCNNKTKLTQTDLLTLSIGAPGSHSKAKEIIAGLVGAEIDRLAETKGRDAWDKHQLKKQAEENAKGLYDDKYGNEPEEE